MLLIEIGKVTYAGSEAARWGKPCSQGHGLSRDLGMEGIDKHLSRRRRG